jgi:hypothetical protein
VARAAVHKPSRNSIVSHSSRNYSPSNIAFQNVVGFRALSSEHFRGNGRSRQEDSAMVECSASGLPLCSDNMLGSRR